jgi:CheY-like chemotaxis protein
VESADETLTEATVEPGAVPGDYVRLTVSDTGTGMTADVLAHAFEPFFTTKPAGQGTGLGLSQVYGFVSQSKGAVRLDSTPGEGTSVHLYLPRHQADVDAVASEPAASPAIGAPRGATVLLVEDEPHIRAFLSEALDDLGFRVILAENGAVGLEALRAAAGELNLLIADVGLPGGLNGRQLADAGRALLPHLPVLLITGYAGDAIAPGALPPGFSVLAKPFTLETLVQRLIAIFASMPGLPPPI